MLANLVWVAAAVIGAWAMLQARTPRHAAVPRMLALFAVAMAFTRFWAVGLRAFHVELTSGGVLFMYAVAGLLLWAPVAWLAAYDLRRRDLYWRIPLLILALISGLSNISGGVPAVLTVSAVSSFRWRGLFSTQRLFRLALYAAALVLLVSFTKDAIDTSRLPKGTAGAILRFSAWSSFVGTYYGIIGAIALLFAFVRDPSLGIRTVSRRLALSHWLAVLVPLLLVTGLWVFTTILGVNNDRAQLATRAIELEADRLHAELGLAMDSGAPDSSLRRLAAARTDRWPDMRVWRLLDGDAVRLTGPDMYSRRWFPGWADSLDSLRASGIIALREGNFLGAMLRSEAPGRGAALALVPIDSVLARIRDQLGGTELELESFSERRWTRDSLAQARADSVARAAGTLTGPGDDSPPEPPGGRGRVRITTPRDTLVVSSEDSTGSSFVLQGRSNAGGMVHLARGWTPRAMLISAYLSPAKVLTGLFASSARDQIGVITMFFILLAGLIAVAVALFDVIMVGSMGRSITAAIRALREGATRLQAGDLSHRVVVRGQDDLWGVAEALNHAADGLERARALEKERNRLENELEVARQIQARLLPADPPDIPGLEIAGLSESAREVGGDYFDHIDLGGGRVLLVIADVSGKGVPAALLMSGFRASLVSQDLARSDPPALASRLNDFLHRSVEVGKFVTAFLCFVDAASGRLVYVNAGHNPPVLMRADGRHEELVRGGLILGVMPHSVFESGEAQLAPGDMIVLYTDGVVEGQNATGELWGETRLLESLRRRRGQSARVLIEQIAAEVRAFEGEIGPADDVTLLIARRTA